MKQVTMHEAKTHLSRLVDMALAGEEVIIARRDRPLVRLTAVTETPKGRRVGGLPHLIAVMGDQFNAPIEDWDESPVPGPASTNTPKQSAATRKAKGS